MFFFFFFQAEDGIRDIGVTGVQTCALPISERDADHPADDVDVGEVLRVVDLELIAARVDDACGEEVDARRVRERALADEPARSEERRVGKECRSRWSQYH